MKKLIIVGSMLIAVLGCAAVKQAKVDATACLVDPVCRAEAVAQAETAKSIAKDVSGISPIPLSSNLVGGIAYGSVFLFALIKGGRRKNEAVNG